MKICHVIVGLDVGGAETMLVRLVAGLKAPFEHDVISLTDEGPLAPNLREMGVPVTHIGLKRGVPSPVGVARLRGAIAACAPAVIQTWMYHSDLLGGLAGKSLGRPVVWGIHVSELNRVTTPLATRLTIRACAALSSSVPTRIVSCARSAADDHVERGYPREKVVVIPNGVDTAAFAASDQARRDLRAELGLPGDAFLVGLVARFHPQKDHRNFVQAAATFRDRQDVHFVLAGRDVTPANRELMGWIDSAGMSDRIHVLGPRSDTSPLFAAFDLGTLTSTYGEAFPLVVVEGMACAVPWVVTDVGDSKDIVGGTGRSVPPRRPDLLAAAWREILESDGERRRELGRAARERVVTRFDLARTLQAYAAVYEEVHATWPRR